MALGFRTAPMEYWMTMNALAQRRADFRALHTQGCFVIPNPWDVGSAVALAAQGFKALATTSSGHAWSCGRPDGAMSRDEVVAHIRLLAGATDLPLNADFESGFGDTPAAVHESVRVVLDTGLAGLSIEDASGDVEHPLRSIDDAVARLRAARAAIDRYAPDVMLIGRAENFFVGRPDLQDTVTRIGAYAEAGADCLYAPGLSTVEQIRAVVAAAGGKPVNLLLGAPGSITVAEAAALGVRRISLGGSLARSAWGGFLQASRTILEQGTFEGIASTPTGRELNGLLAGSPTLRSSNPAALENPS